MRVESSKLDGVSMVFPTEPAPYVAGNMEPNEDPPVDPLSCDGNSSEDVDSKHVPQEESLPINVDHATFKTTMYRGNRKYFCPICKDVKTGYYSDYLRHTRVHTGERPFVCPMCPYACKQKPSLMEHVKKQHHMQV